MDERVKDGFLRLHDELVEEVLIRLPPDEPACLVRAFAVRKHWRRILADDGFRSRYREFHATPPVLGFFQEDSRFVATSALLPAQPDHLGMIALDCRHGRALLSNPWEHKFTVLDPLTGHQSPVPYSSGGFTFSAAVLCSTQGCDHHGCQGGHFLVACVCIEPMPGITSAYVYSSETCEWSELTSHHGTGLIVATDNVPSVLVGDAIYFNIAAIAKCQLSTLSLSMMEKPTYGDGALMKAEDGGLGFATVTGTTNLTLWSMETGPEGAMGWAKIRVIDLKILLPDGALSIPTLEYGSSWSQDASVSGFVEGTQVIFVSTCAGLYIVDLKSRRARKVSRKMMYPSYGQTCFPYTSFYIPAMEAASTSQGK